MIRRLRIGAWVLVCLMAGVASGPVAAAADEEEEPLPAPATEKDVPFPKYPAVESLIAFNAGAASANRYFLDQTSISIGEGEVVRFVLVTRTPNGVENVSFEGIRCRSRERRLYATGRADRTWSRSRNQKWMEIGSSTISLPHFALATEYLCNYGAPIRSPKQGIEAIRRGGQPDWLGI